MINPADNFNPAAQRAKVDSDRAYEELADAQAALRRALYENVHSEMLRDLLMVKIQDYAIAYRGITEAEHAEENAAYVKASINEIDKVIAAGCGIKP